MEHSEKECHERLLIALRACWKFIDDLADGAPDSGSAAHGATRLWPIVKDALEKHGDEL